MGNLTTKEINSLAIKAQKDLQDGNGRTNKVWQLIAVFTDQINELERIHGNNYNNEIAFVEKCEKKIEYAAKAFSPRIQDFEGLVKHTLRQTVKDFYKRRSRYKKLHDSYEYITNAGKNDTPPQYIRDPTTLTADYVVSKEFCGSIIDKYGTDDRRRFILIRWIEEGRAINNAELAREMIEFFGGVENTHVQFIKRLRSQMRQAIA